MTLLAETMYDKIFNFKFTPSGRGFWVMGSDVLRHRGGAALNNCAFVSTQGIDENFSRRPFTFLMDLINARRRCRYRHRGAGRWSFRSQTPQMIRLLSTTPERVDLIEMVLDSRSGASAPASSTTAKQARRASLSRFFWDSQRPSAHGTGR